MEELKSSLSQYNEQLCMIREALVSTSNEDEQKPLLALKSELEELVKLTQESVDTLAQSTGLETVRPVNSNPTTSQGGNAELDDEFALFMREMAESGAYSDENDKKTEESSNTQQDNDTSDIEDELSTLLGMKCAVYHTHKWGGQPSLHNAMVSAVVPHQDSYQFCDLQVQVLFTHPTHAEMLPCPFYLEGNCRFDDEKCRFSHGAIVPLSNLKDAIEPNFSTMKVGSRVLLKLKPPDDEDISLTKKSMEKYHLWHRAVVKSVNFDEKLCTVKMEHGTQTGEKRKFGSDELCVHFEEMFPLNKECDTSSDSDDSLSDTEYPEYKTSRVETEQDHHQALYIEKSLQNKGPAMGEWERHTRGIGSKLMLAMGYVPGSGLGADAGGRVQPVEARVLPVGKSLDHCMAISEKAAQQDPLKVTQKLRKLQKKEEERNKKAYEREKERHDRNVFNFLNRTLGNTQDQEPSPIAGPSADIKQLSTKELNVEQFKIAEDTRRIEREIIKLNSSLARYSSVSEGYRNISKQVVERNLELNKLKSKEQQIAKEKNYRKNKQSMTVF